MYYTIYQITNLVNGKTYVGAHKTKDLEDDYMGSGKILLRAIEKYGVENFSKEILEVFDTSEEMFEMEATLVNEDYIIRKDTYNIKPGGFGGFDYIRNHPDYAKWQSESAKKGGLTKHISEVELSKRIGEGVKKAWNLGKFTDRQSSGACAPGFVRSKEHSKNISMATKGTRIGKNNSQFGIRFKWMNNTLTNKKVPMENVDQYLQDSWVFGRISKT